MVYAMVLLFMLGPGAFKSVDTQKRYDTFDACVIATPPVLKAAVDDLPQIPIIMIGCIQVNETKAGT